MVNNRGIAHSKNSSILCKRSSLLSATLYVVTFLTFSIFFFTFYSRDILEDEEKPLLISKGEFKSEKMRDDALWEAPSSSDLHSCVKPTSRYKAAQGWDRYITVRSNGGLNQMRTGIADMVAVAHIMNATLVIPQLDKRSFWQDKSTFADIFDQTHFIMNLQTDVKVVKELPKELESAPQARKHFSSWSGMSYYEEMTQLWKDYKVIHVAKSDSRLANNDLPLDIQRLRCRALYHALCFSPTIENLGKVLRIHDDDTAEASGAAEISCGKIHCASFEI